MRRLISKSGLFKPSWYLERYPDLAAAGVDPLDHYLLARRGGAAPILLQCSTRAVTPKSTRTIRTRRTIRCCTMSEMADPATRWSAKCGVSSGNPGLFKPSWYLTERYPDWQLPASIPLIIICSPGAAELRDPSPMFYARRYAEEHAAIRTRRTIRCCTMSEMADPATRWSAKCDALSTSPGFLSPHGILTATGRRGRRRRSPRSLPARKAQRNCAILHRISPRSDMRGSTAIIRGPRRTLVVFH